MKLIDRYRLNTFCEIISKLNNNPFVRNLMSSQQISMSPNMADKWPNFLKHRQSTIDSFVLNFRFLIMKRDGLSLNQTYDKLKKQNLLSPRSDQLKHMFDKVASRPFPIGFGDKTWNYEGLFETMFYGGLAHHNEDKIIDYINYKSNILVSALSFECFKQYVAHGIFLGKGLRSDIIKANLP